MQETLLRVEFRYGYPEGNISSVCYDDGEFIDVTPIVCIAMYLRGAWTHNVAPQRLRDTSQILPGALMLPRQPRITAHKNPVQMQFDRDSASTT